MTRKSVDVRNLLLHPFAILEKDWMLLTAGDFAGKDFNCMAIGWGSMGTMWSKPLVMVVVRPTRHTYRFMEKFDSFTVCALPEKFKDALSYMGSHSGRDGDKIKATGLTPIKSVKIQAPGFDEAELIIECRKMYFDDFDPAHFISPDIAKNYNGDYHRMYFGEVLHLSASGKYAK